MAFPDGLCPDWIIVDWGSATIFLIEGLAAEKKFKKSKKLSGCDENSSEDAEEF